jgi:hypothetical protein
LSGRSYATCWGRSFIGNEREHHPNDGSVDVELPQRLDVNMSYAIALLDGRHKRARDSVLSGSDHDQRAVMSVREIDEADEATAFSAPVVRQLSL